MALISIPTSIGGITIPGLNKGPLSSLFGSPYSKANFQYPSDLTAANKNHYVRFDIREIQSADISKATGELKALVTKETAAAVLGAGVANLADSAERLVALDIPLTQNFSPSVSQNPVSTIELYMPDSMDFQSQIHYGQPDLLGTALSLFGNVGRAVNDALKNSSSVTQLALKNFGYAINPQVQLMFESIDFRQYSMSFVFSPNSKEEAQNIQNIIKTFRGWSAPQIVPDTKGMFYRPPAVFDISFYSNGSENTKINRIKRSVVTSVDVNYAPNGWAAHSDGTPVQTTMTLQLQETVLIDRDQILTNGY